MYHNHNMKHEPYHCHITNHVYVQLGTKNINAYFQGNGFTLVGKFEVWTTEQNSAVDTSIFAFAVFLIQSDY